MWPTLNKAIIAMPSNHNRWKVSKTGQNTMKKWPVFVITANFCLGNAKTELPLLTLTNRVKEARPSKNIINFEAGNGNWWRPCNHERKLLIGPEHNFHWLHWRTSCSLIGKYGWKGCGKICNLVCSHLRCSSSRNSLRDIQSTPPTQTFCSEAP